MSVHFLTECMCVSMDSAVVQWTVVEQSQGGGQCHCFFSVITKGTNPASMVIENRKNIKKKRGGGGPKA